MKITIGQAIDNIFEDKSKTHEGVDDDGFRYIMKYSNFSNKIVITGGFCNQVRDTLLEKYYKIDWGLVQKPVTFMEAVESGKLFKVEHISISPDYMSGYYSLATWLDEITTGFGGCVIREILTEGKFYIEEDN